MTTAFVLSGFGSLAAAHVGMLRALVGAGIAPDVVVGTSMGAVNAAFVAARPDEDGIEHLRQVWLEIARHDVIAVANPGRAGRELVRSLPWRPVGGVVRALGLRNHVVPFDPRALVLNALGRVDHIVPNGNGARFLRDRLPIRRFEEARIRLVALATDAETGEPVALSEGDVVPAVLASGAIPGVFPTMTIAGRRLVDGWIARHTALAEAAAVGADEIYVLATGYSCGLPRGRGSVPARVVHTLNLGIEQSLVAAVDGMGAGVTVRVVPPLCPVPTLPLAFDRSELLIDRATDATRAWLEGGRPVPGLSRPLGGRHLGHAAGA